MPPPRNPKICEDCGDEFMPRSGRQVRCAGCKERKKQEFTRRPAADPARKRTYPKPKRGRDLRGSPLALDIEARVRRRIEQMED